MSMRMRNLDDIKEHIEKFGTDPLYWRSDNEFVILAARLSWRGSVPSAAKTAAKKSAADLLEEWLLAHRAKRIEEFTTFEALFGK